MNIGPALVLLGAFVAEQPCPVEKCLVDLRSLARVEVAEVDRAVVLGHWTRGPGLNGGELYVFEDHTYLATEWGCLLPETIRDKGSWAVADGVLMLTPDPEVTWPLRRFGNRRYAALRFNGEVRLFGLDGSLSFLPLILGAEVALPETTEVVRHLSLAHSEASKSKAWRRVKAALLGTAWRPSYFAGEKAP